MDRFTQLNVLCDWGAKDLALVPPPPNRPANVHINRWSLSINGSQVINNIEETVSRFIHDPALKNYWAKKKFLPLKVTLLLIGRLYLMLLPPRVV